MPPRLPTGRHACAGVTNKEHVNLATDVHPALLLALQPADQHQQRGQLHCRQPADLGAHAARSTCACSAQASVLQCQRAVHKRGGTWPR